MGVGEIVKMMEIWVRVRKNLEMGEEEGDEDDQGADGDGGLHPDEDVEAVGSRGGFQEGSRRGRRRTEEIFLLVDNGVVFREEDQKKTHTPAFATALPWLRHPSLSFPPWRRSSPSQLQQPERKYHVDPPDVCSSSPRISPSKRNK